MDWKDWKVGDKAVILRSFPEKIGVVVTILAAARPTAGHMQYPIGTPVHKVDIAPNTGPYEHAYYAPWDLGPVLDSNETTTWEECVWQPKVLERVL